MADRRLFMIMLLLGLAGPALPALAKDGEGGGDGGDGGGDSGGGDDGGKDDSDNSGSGKDDDRDDDKDDDDKDDDDSREDDDDKIRKAVESGRAEPLRKILANVRNRYKGQVVKIQLTGKSPNLVYRIRLIDLKNQLVEVRVNAKTGRILGTAGLY